MAWVLRSSSTDGVTSYAARLLCVFVLLAGAACGATEVPTDGGLDAGGLDAARRDAGPIDAGPSTCVTDSSCAPGSRCFRGTCQPDPCATASPCEDDLERCRAVCVDLVDPCASVTCGASETCVDGVCFAGCLPAPCDGTVCPGGYFCDPASGGCRRIDRCSADCGADSACHFTCTTRTSCEDVACEEGELCRDGACLVNPCFGIDCEPGEVCSNGDCVATCDCEPACTPPERCVANECVCAPRCPAGSACGAADGCGGRCAGSCPDPRQTCDLGTGACECTPSCADDAACGDDDGCGGRCEGPCADARTCVEGVCTCTDVCRADDDVACGSDIPDTCLGSDCEGAGTRCLVGWACMDGACCPPCGLPFDVACGAPIPDAVDDDGAVCRTCGLGVACGAGESCRINPPGGGDPAARVCCGLCAEAADVPCGTRIPDALDASGSVCRTCLGYGTAGCGSGEGCTGGPVGVCCAECASPDSVDCGAPIPDPPCRTCAEVGARCPVGTTCTDPPGTIDGEARECCGSCPDAAAVPCGEAIPAVLGDDGAVCRTCGEGTMCASGERCADAVCCALTCAAASSRPCGSTPPDGCGGTCEPGTMCGGAGEACTGDPLHCECAPSCGGRRCGESDGCGGECAGTCDAGFVCAERPPPASPGDYECEPSACVASCGLCESCVLGTCEPLSCGPSETVCLARCECCGAGQVCTPTGCDDFG